MPTTVSDDKATRVRSNWRPLVLDLLKESFDENSGIRRDSNDLVVDEPWALARFGRVTLRRGWWTFECEGEGDVSGVELRLMSPEDTLIAFSMRRALKARAFFHRDKLFDVALLASAWPDRVKLKMLRLRRLSGMEEARLAGAMLLRLAKSDKPFAKLMHVTRRVLAGRSLRINSNVSPETADALSKTHVLADSNLRAVVHDGVTAVLRHDERLHPRAMEIAARVFARSPKLRAFYADLSECGKTRPRPEWDAELAEVSSYADSPVFFRGETEATETWSRLIEISVKSGAIARVALPLALRETVIGEAITPPPVPRLSSVPLVSIVIPTKIRIDLLERCLQGLVERTDYPALEVVIVNGCSDHPRFEEVIARASKKLRLRRVDDSRPFNFSRLVNLGVRNSEGEVVLLLNDDVEAIETGWLHRIVESAIAPGVGCVGARLLYPDRTIQHAGVTLGVSGVCGHLWKGLSTSEAALIPQVVLPSQRMAVTGACLAVRRELFDRVGGLDETNFPVAFNDVDFCLRVRALGYRTIYRGDAALIHHEVNHAGWTMPP